MMPRRAIGLVALAAGSLALPACERGAAPLQDAPFPGIRIVDAPAQPDQTYVGIRGRVYNIPAGGPTEEFLIAHETIPGFVDRTGAIVGMNAMIMPFPAVQRGVDLDGLREGDPIEFTFAVDWDGDPRWVITALSVLPADAELDLNGVWPTDGAPADTPSDAPADIPSDD